MNPLYYVAIGLVAVASILFFWSSKKPGTGSGTTKSTTPPTTTSPSVWTEIGKAFQTRFGTAFKIVILLAIAGTGIIWMKERELLSSTWGTINADRDWKEWLPVLVSFLGAGIGAWLMFHEPSHHQTASSHPHSGGGFWPKSLGGWILVGFGVIVLGNMAWETWKAIHSPAPAEVERDIQKEISTIPRYYRTGKWEETLSPGQFSQWIEFPKGYKTLWGLKDKTVDVVLMQMGRRVGNDFVDDNQPPRPLDKRLVIAPGEDTVIRVGGVGAVTLVIERH